MDTIHTNPVNVFEALAKKNEWNYQRENDLIHFYASLKSHPNKTGVSRIQWFKKDKILVSAAIWSYADIEVDELQMHRATAEVNLNIWEGFTFWHEPTKNIIIRVVRQLEDDSISPEAAEELHLLPLNALQQSLGTFDGFASGNSAYLKMLTNTEVFGKA